MSVSEWEMVDEYTRRRRDVYPTEVQTKCCGRWLPCPGFTNTCLSCGYEYNWAGEQLVSRCFWGEETGEHPCDVSRID